MFIEECPRTGKPLFRVGIKSSNKWFVGYTPTDPWTKWCLEQSRNGNSRASGPAFYGFSDKVLQHALRCLVIHTDVNEYRYRMGDSGIGDPAYSPPAVNVSEFTAEEQSTLVSRVVDLVSNGDLPISWGRVSEAFPRRPGFLCQSEYNRLGGTVVMGVAIPLSEVPIEEPYVAVDLLSKGLAKVGTGRKKNGESKASGRDKNRRSRGQESSDRRKRPRNEDSDSDDLGPVSGGSGVEAENPCAEKRDALTFSNMHLPTVCPCGKNQLSWIFTVAISCDLFPSVRLRM